MKASIVAETKESNGVWLADAGKDLDNWVVEVAEKSLADLTVDNGDKCTPIHMTVLF